MPPLISIVVPMHNEEEALAPFLAAVTPVLESLTDRYEIVCVNDGSTDATLAALIGARARNPAIRIVDLSRNFGKELALTAGLDHAAGEAVIPIDADLQDPPELIPAMVEKWREGYEMVIAVRADRKSDSWFKRATAGGFYRIAGRLSQTRMPSNAGDFRLMDRKVVDALKLLPERTRFMKGIFGWLGFRQAQVEYTRARRVAGSSKWKVWKLWNLALEGIFSFTTLPLRVWTYAGFTVAALAIAFAIFIIVQTVFTGVDVPGYASTIVVILFFSGLNMFGLGVLGEYVGRIFIEVKRRPLYLVRETIGVEGGAASHEGPPSEGSGREDPAL